MYIYLENNFFIPLTDIITIISNENFKKSLEGKEFYKTNKNKIINLSEKEEKTVIVTNKYIYISSYSLRTLYERGYEFINLKKSKNRTGGITV